MPPDHNSTPAPTMTASTDMSQPLSSTRSVTNESPTNHSNHNDSVEDETSPT